MPTCTHFMRFVIYDVKSAYTKRKNYRSPVVYVETYTKVIHLGIIAVTFVKTLRSSLIQIFQLSVTISSTEILKML